MFNFLKKKKKKKGTYFSDTKGNLYRSDGYNIFSVKIKK